MSPAACRNGTRAAGPIRVTGGLAPTGTSAFTSAAPVLRLPRSDTSRRSVILAVFRFNEAVSMKPEFVGLPDPELQI